MGKVPVFVMPLKNNPYVIVNTVSVYYGCANSNYHYVETSLPSIPNKQWGNRSFHRCRVILGNSGTPFIVCLVISIYTASQVYGCNVDIELPTSMV